MHAKCILCQSRPPIENSHVIPKFVVRRLKAGNPVGTLIHSNDLNRVAQDGWKGDYLCKVCEQDFSKLEGWFCNKVYDPFLANGSVAVNYGEELGLFVASVGFRYIHLALEMNPNKPVAPAFGRMFENLRTSLLSKDLAAVSSHLYIQFLSPVTSLGPFPPGINTYFSESMDGKCFDYVIPGQGTFWVTYVKFSGMFFLFSEWDLKRAFKPEHHAAVDSHWIQGSGVLDSSSQSGILEKMVGDILCARSVEIQTNYSKMLPKRLAQILKKIAAVPDKGNFRSHETFLLDQKLLAEYEKAKQQKPPT